MADEAARIAALEQRARDHIAQLHAAHAAQVAALQAQLQAAQGAAVAGQQQQLPPQAQHVAAPAPHRAPEPRMPPPPAFDGAAGSLDTWLVKMDQQFYFYGYSDTDHAPRIRLAVMALGDAAFEWWGHTPAGSRPATWTAFVAALRTRFQPVTSADVARDQLMQLHQGKGHVNTYIAAFRKLLMRVPDMSAADQLYHFRRGLKPPLAARLLETNTTDLEAAINLAARVGTLGEAVAAQSSSNTSSGASHAGGDAMQLDAIEGLERETRTSEGSGAGAPAQIAELQQQMQQLLAAMRSQRAPAGAGAGAAAAASNPRGAGRFGRGPPRIPHLTPVQVQEYMDEGKCFGCGSKEHQSRGCPKRRVGADGKVTWSN